ncbi:MAG: zf-HC2 domain-containing protein [Acidobacteriota bacterium]
MKLSCQDQQNRIFDSLLGLLDAEEQQSLDAHLAECPHCLQERILTEQTVQQLRQEKDVPVPRHFFVYPEQSPSSWKLLLQLSTAWKAAFGAGALAVVALAVLLATQAEVSYRAGTLQISFGRPVEENLPAPQPRVEAAALKAELLQSLQDNWQRERAEWIAAMQREVRRSSSRLSQRQQQLLAAAIGDLESRFSDRMSDTATALQSRTDQSLATMYKLLQGQRQNDVRILNERFNRLVAQGEIKKNETDEILATLLQVAEMKMK